MKFAYKFSNLLGCCYRKGNLVFSPDGNRLISPVGNRVSLFDLKSAKMETLPLECVTNITAVAVSPSGHLLIVVSEDGKAVMVNTCTRASLPLFTFRGVVHAICFSPDGKKVAVTQDSNVLVFHAPGQTVEFNPFVLFRSFYGSYDETTCIDWTTDSSAFCVGGKDMHARVQAVRNFKNLVIYSLPSHKDAVIGAFFEHNSLDVYSVSRNGQLFVFQCDTELKDLVEADFSRKPKRGSKSAAAALVDDEESSSDEEEDADKTKKRRKTEGASDKEATKKILYKRIASHNLNEGRDNTTSRRTFVTCAAFHKLTHILVMGFDDGSFTIHEMPDFNLLQSFTISDTGRLNSISSVAINKTADWLALGSSELGMLCVWEWQSESFILRQQSHFGSMSCLAYSPDGQYIVTGGDDSKVKVWKTSDGFCFVTFSEHCGAVTGVAFSQSGQVVVSASFDGTVRAFDLNKYRNFRTFTSPEGRPPCQFSCLALDVSGEIVVAGTQDSFEIYVWSMQTGKLLEILTGHEGPVSCVTFSSAHSTLASGSWDHSVRLWDVFTSKGARTIKPFSCDVLALAYSPDGRQLAVATLNAYISFMDVQSEDITGTIEGRHDLGYTRNEDMKITAKRAADGKAFLTLCYTADGKHLLAGGRSKNIAIYSVEHQLLCKMFEVTCNLSFDGTKEFLDRRKMTEWGSLAMVDDGQGDVDGQTISLPGVRKGDLSSRHWKPEVRVSCVRFAPTGRAFAATTTEGLLVYSLDHNVAFDPFELDTTVTPDSVRSALMNHEFVNALMLAFRLNEQPIICHVVERIPPSEIDYICRSLPDIYIDRLFPFIAGQLESSAHKGFYVTWNQLLLERQGTRLKQRSLSVLPAIRDLQKSLRHVQDLNKIYHDNKYMLRYEQTLAALAHKQQKSDDVAEMSLEAVKDDSDDDGIDTDDGAVEMEL
jgi:periodic tryptophan protein 2